MKTFFYNKAKSWVDSSQTSFNKNENLLSWVKTGPARVNFFLDLICNIIKAPFNLLFLTFGTIRAGYSLGKETKWMKNGARNLYHNGNDSISDTAGMFITKKGCELRDKNNLGKVVVCYGMDKSWIISTWMKGKYNICKIRFQRLFEPIFSWNKHSNKGYN